MVNAVPKWVWKRYALLWKELKDKKFSYDEAEKILKHDDKNTISVMFLELRKAGWMVVELDQADARKRLYSLHPPETIVEATKYDFKKDKS